MQQFNSKDGKKFIYKSLGYTFSVPKVMKNYYGPSPFALILRMRFLEEIGFWCLTDGLPLFIQAINNQRHLIDIPEIKVDIHKYILLEWDDLKNFLTVFQTIGILLEKTDYMYHYKNMTPPEERPRLWAHEMAYIIMDLEKKWYTFIDHQEQKIDQKAFENILKMVYGKKVEDLL